MGAFGSVQLLWSGIAVLGLIHAGARERARKNALVSPLLVCCTELLVRDSVDERSIEGGRGEGILVNHCWLGIDEASIWTDTLHLDTTLVFASDWRWNARMEDNFG